MIMDGLYRASILLFLLFLLDVPRVEARVISEDCICSGSDYDYLDLPVMSHYAENLVGVGRSMEIICCAEDVLGRKINSSFTVSWFLNGTQLRDSQSTFDPNHGCRNETIFSKAAKKSDQGTYTCNVSTPEGEQATATTKLFVQQKSGYHEGVKGVEIDKCKSEGPCILQARLSQELKITCRALVGNSSPYVAWLPWRCSFGIEDCLEFDEHVVKEGNDFMTNTMTIPSVTRKHFTTFTCLANNAAGESKNKTITIQEEGELM